MGRLIPQLIIGYKEFYNEDPPEDRLSLIGDLSRSAVIYELAALNYRLKPKDKVYIDTSFETQASILNYFARTERLGLRYSRIADFYTKSRKEYPMIFSRQACLFGLEELSDNYTYESDTGSDPQTADHWESIIAYILAVNSAISSICPEVIEGEDRSFETLNPHILPLNELLIETNPIYTPYRGYKLFEFLNDSSLSTEFNGYINEKYGVEPFEYLFKILSLYLAPNQPKPEWNFFYNMESDDQFIKALSDRIASQDHHRLISIKKSPFIQVGSTKFVIADNAFLLDKCYKQFINDFWFDCLKKVNTLSDGSRINIKKYRSVIGRFFETHIDEIVKASFAEYRYSVLLTFNELKVQGQNGAIEITDIYLRSRNRILLAEVKSSDIYDEAKFSGNVEQLYRQDRDGFFKNFGIDQVVSSILKLDAHMQLLDEGYPKGKTLNVYPCLVVNDKALQTPLMADVFNKRFVEVLEGKEISPKMRVYSLAVIHVSDLESIENGIREKPKLMWDLLKLNSSDKKFVPPFHISVQRSNVKFDYAARAKNLLVELARKFGQEGFG